MQLSGISAATGGVAVASARPHNFTDVESSGNEAELGLSLPNGSIV